MASTDVLTGTIDPRWAKVRPLVFKTIIGAVVPLDWSASSRCSSGTSVGSPCNSC